MKPRDVVAEWPETELEPVAGCPVCGHNNRRLLYAGLTDRVHHCAPGAWNLHQCQQCGAAYLDPRPTPSSIWRAYTNYYTHKMAGINLTLSFRQRLRRALRNGYINSKYGSSLKPATGLGKWVVPLLYGKQGEIDHGLRNLPRLDIAGSRKVLDIGCGNGSFLQEAAQLGWDARGIDPDPSAASHIAGLRVEQGALPKTEFRDATFDVITLSHVIEHTHDPVASLREVYRLLKPGGRIWLATPNVAAAGHRRFRKNWIGLHPPAHLVLFTHASILHALCTVGFDEAHFSSMHPQARGYHHMSWRIAQGEYPFAEAGRPLPFSIRLIAAIDDLLSAIWPNHREEIVVTARKPF
jgi:2-polyprenyl-3-methyl-5-hydroxy-6-metoxy-1,4-benzoquinol methylase